MWCPDEPLHRHARSLVWLGGLFFFCEAAAAQNPGPPLNLDDYKIPLWYPSFEVRAGAGYNDNVLLSNTNAEGSAFLGAGVNVIVIRLPSAGWQFNAFLDATDAHFFDAPSVDNEQVVLASAELTRIFDHGWKSALGLSYLFQNQVFDMSATYTNQSSVGLVRGHSLSPRWKVRWSSPVFWTEAEVSGTRQILDSPLDSYWQVGPRVTVGHSYTNGSELSLTYRGSLLEYDSREQVDRSGMALTNTSLAFRGHAVELGWIHLFDASREWRLRVRAGFLANLDNGSGFYDYYIYRLSGELRFRPKKWELKALAQVGYYDYPRQTVSATDLSLRHKTMIILGLSSEYQFSRYFKAYTNYSWQRSLSNLDFDDYHANIVSGGLATTF